MYNKPQFYYSVYPFCKWHPQSRYWTNRRWKFHNLQWGRIFYFCPNPMSNRFRGFCIFFSILFEVPLLNSCLLCLWVLFSPQLLRYHKRKVKQSRIIHIRVWNKKVLNSVLFSFHMYIYITSIAFSRCKNWVYLLK